MDDASEFKLIRFEEWAVVSDQITGKKGREAMLGGAVIISLMGLQDSSCASLGWFDPNNTQFLIVFRECFPELKGFNDD